MDSILTSIKQMLGIEEVYTHFDANIIMHINTTFLSLQQIGVGPEEGFIISDDSARWVDFIDNDKLLQAVKSYMYVKVKLLFDPPNTSFVLDALERLATQLEWRLNIQVDKPAIVEVVNEL